MKAIHANPTKIRELFTKQYTIPEFQRPYSWSIEHCDKLWDDLIDFFENKKQDDEKYFLGNIVISEDAGKKSVIDGQQRMTTLVLLIRALFGKAGTTTALEECLKVKDPLTSKLSDELRIKSYVVEDDKNSLYDIVFNSGNNLDATNQIKINYLYFCDLIDNWWNENNNCPQKLSNLILTLLDWVVILPIECETVDDALTIFQTINDRGLALSDSDIFKARLHAISPDTNQFIQEWNELEDHLWLFRILMHIIKAKKGDHKKEVALRAYFDQKDKLENQYNFVLSTLKKIQLINYWDCDEQTHIYWNILELYPNYYWNFPLFVFLNKYGIVEDNNFILPDKYKKDFFILLEETVRYFYIKGVVHNAVNRVRDTVLRVCVYIEKGDDYISEYKKNSFPDYSEFERKVKASDCKRYLKGIVVLAAALNNIQSKKTFAQFLTSGYHIEHILPKIYNNYDYWDDKLWKEHLNLIGNLVPLEWRLNISAKNEFFDRKKNRYKDSCVENVKDLLSLNEWTPDRLIERNNFQIKKLLNFFINDYKKK